MSDDAGTLTSDSVTSDEFRDIVGRFASGVTVISTAHDGLLYGTTASAVSSLSLEPPMMLACLNTSSASHDAVLRSGVFGISILAAGQGALAYHFGRRGADKFADVPHTIGAEGVPLVDAALAAIVCRVEETVRGGTHTVFLGRVISAEATALEPLSYYRGRLGRLAESAERSAYEEVRSAVLKRRTALHQPIDVDALANIVGADAGQVDNALIRLSVEGLVTRADDGSLRPTPITASVIADNYEARLSIEIGVLEARLSEMDDATKARIVEVGDAIAQVRSEKTGGLDEYLRLNVEYHSALVGISGSEQLVESFRRLGIGTAWRQGLTDAEWSDELDNKHVAQLTSAILAGDLSRAKEALRQHSAFASALAERVIERVGGVV